jgi:hypothetical protein
MCPTDKIILTTKFEYIKRIFGQIKDGIWMCQMYFSALLHIYLKNKVNSVNRIAVQDKQQGIFPWICRNPAHCVREGGGALHVLFNTYCKHACGDVLSGYINNRGNRGVDQCFGIET